MNETVAQRLRTIAELLATHDASDTTRRDVEARLDEVARVVARDPLRPRWYDVDATDRDASRAYHEEFGRCAVPRTSSRHR